MPLPDENLLVSAFLQKHLGPAEKAAPPPEPTEAELAELRAIEAEQAACPKNHDPRLLGEDGCIECGFYAP